jgi:serine/threonine-protein phosphatase 6 regulatory ankyrin repeat subunit B
MYATTYGNVEVVQALLAAKADVNAKDYIGRTALMLASEAGRDEVVKLLRQAGAKA